MLVHATIIGEKIKQLRQEQGLTQEQLAEALNIFLSGGV